MSTNCLLASQLIRPSLEGHTVVHPKRNSLEKARFSPLKQAHVILPLKLALDDIPPPKLYNRDSCYI